MFFHLTPPVATPAKRIIYLILSVLLGALLGFLACVFIEIKYLNSIIARDTMVGSFNGAAVLPLLYFGLPVTSAVGGFFSGKFWWKKVYIERFWEKKLTK